MILLIDNYDSFAHNLARHVRLLGVPVQVERNDILSIDNVKTLSPHAIILSPGPCGPAQAGICVDLVRELGSTIPILGVCLGHQCINEAYGGKTLHAPAPMHGRASAITHDGTGVFTGLPSPFNAGRYHSLACELNPSSPLRITARSDDGVIMGFSHPVHPVHGEQFHPESILTEHGLRLLENFVKG
jgi:anthranilate synthase component 2/para-aminobenzoate synthetase component 2